MPDRKKIWPYVRYSIGNVWRYFSSSIYNTSVQPEQSCTIFGSSFGKNGWNHIVRTLEEYDNNPSIDYKETTLFRFLKMFIPRGINDFVLSEVDSLPLFVYPWGSFKCNEAISDKDPWNSRFCGPSTDLFIEEEFKRTINLYNIIKQKGYKPYTYPNSFIVGTWLVSRNNERRFVVLQGNHRMAIFSHLGLDRVEVRPLRGYLYEVCENEVQNWLLVASGACRRDYALDVFHWFFKNDGHHLEDSINNYN